MVNEALKLPRGKLAAQVAHASVASLLSTNIENQKKWFEVGMPKVVLAVQSEEELVSCQEQAQLSEVPAQIIRDAGKTVLAAGTITCLGIGPAPVEDIDRITGELKLLG